MIKIYNIFFTIFFLPVILILSIFSKKIRGGIKEKFGFYDFDFSNSPKTLWIHAVSVGEVQLVTTFIKELKDFDIVVTTSTPQGQELAQKQLKDYTKKITYFPYDFGFSVKSAFKKINPSAIIVAETEIWPEFSSTAKKNNIPLVIVNGRISERTFKSYYKLNFFFKNILKNYTVILTQTDDDKERFIKIAQDGSKIKTMGNIKFDIQKPEIQLNDELKLNFSKLIVAGSTHNGEDEIIINAFKNLKKKYKDIKLLIAPRHLERVTQIQTLTPCGLKSKDNFLTHDILILDTTGELKNMYAYCHTAFIGGSFNKTGGHNPLEATVWGKPVITGPNIKNFKLIYKNLVEFECAKVVKTQEDLETTLDNLLNNANYYEKTCTNCEKVLKDNSGATKYLIDYINKEIRNND